MRNIIYCFSGTGNCLAIARSVEEKLTDTEVASIMTLQGNMEDMLALNEAKYDAEQ